MTPPRGVGVETGVAFGREGGSARRRETLAASKEWLCVFRGPEDCRRFFVVMEAALRRLGSGGDSGGKRAESGEDALREPFGEVGIGGARSFACISSRNSRFPRLARLRRGRPRCGVDVSLVAVLFQVELIVFFGVVFR